MNSTNEETSFTISTQETPLLQNDPPKQPRIKNLKTKIFFTLRILIVLIAGVLILYSIYSKNRKKPEKPLNRYLSGLSKNYCHLTRHPKLCHDSMSSIANATALDSGPALIFSSSLQLAVAELNHSTVAITKALSFPASNASLVGPRLSTCQTLAGDSLSRLDRSLDMLGLDLFFYVEDYNITDEIKGVKNNSDVCLSALREIDREPGVEEVKLGVEKARRLVVNFMSLFDVKASIFSDYYTRFSYFEDERYNNLYSYFFHFNSYYWYGFDYGLMVCLYSVMYLFVALLYFLFWQ